MKVAAPKFLTLPVIIAIHYKGSLGMYPAPNYLGLISNGSDLHSKSKCGPLGLKSCLQRNLQLSALFAVVMVI